MTSLAYNHTATKRIRRTLFLLFIVFISFSLFANTSFSQQNASKIYDQIKSYLPSNISAAEKLVKSYEIIGLETNNEEIKANTDYLHALINYFNGKLYISNKYYSKALNSNFAKSDLRFTEKCHNNMGINYEILNMLPESIVAYQKSLQIAEKLKDSLSIYQSYINIGLLNAKTKKYVSARQMTSRALDYFSRQKDSINMVLCYKNLTYISEEHNDSKKAKEYILKGLKISEALGDKYETAVAYYNLAHNFYNTNDLANSEIYVQKSLATLPKDNMQEGFIAQVYLQQGLNQSGLRNYKAAEKTLKYALKIIEETGSFENTAKAYESLADLYARSNNYLAYNQITTQFNKINAENNKAESIKRIDELQALYEFEKKADQIAAQQKNIHLQNKQLNGLIIFVVIILFILAIILTMHLRMRAYTRSLFNNKVEQTKQESLIEKISESVNTDNQILRLYNRVVHLMNENTRNKEITMADLTSELGETEEKIADAIQTYGKKDYHAFLSNFYIDNICRKMIAEGKALTIKKIIQDSPFTNVTEFNKQFKETTGLTPDKFIDYSEKRLQQERKQK